MLEKCIKIFSEIFLVSKNHFKSTTGEPVGLEENSKKKTVKRKCLI